MRRIWMKAAVVAVALMVASGCTYAFTDSGRVATCDQLVYEVNDHGLDPDGTMRAAIDAAFARFGQAIGRPVRSLGSTAASVTEHEPTDPVLVELAWPDDAPTALGYAEPAVIGSTYVSGWIRLNPVVAAAPSGLIRRVVLHEIGHLVGLAHVDASDELMDPDLPVDDYGWGDLYGLNVTHGGFCS
jgi:hypothetical protein